MSDRAGIDDIDDIGDIAEIVAIGVLDEFDDDAGNDGVADNMPHDCHIAECMTCY